MKNFNILNFEGEFSKFLARKYGDGSSDLENLLFYMAMQLTRGHLRISFKDNEKENQAIVEENILKWGVTSDDSGAFIDNMVRISLNLQELIEKNDKIFGKSDDFKPVIQDGKNLYFQKYHELEKRFVFRMQHHLNFEDESISIERINRSVAETVEHALTSKTALNEEQIKALHVSLKKNLILITGGPGTGKTTLAVNILRAFLYFHDALKFDDFNLILTAPTGKAASRLSESVLKMIQNETLSGKSDKQKKIDEKLNISGKTLHRLLGFKQFFKQSTHKKRILLADLIIVDEASMIDFSLMNELLESIPYTAKLVLLGDRNQLPSVGSGTLFSDLIPGLENKRHKLFKNTVFLHKSMRFGKEIAHFAQIVNNQDLENFDDVFKQNNKENEQSNLHFLDGDLFCIHQTGNASQAFKSLLKNQFEWMQLKENERKKFFTIEIPEEKIFQSEKLDVIFSKCSSFKILSATNDGVTGVKNLNALCENLCERKPGEIYEGLPVIILENDYSNHLFNGITGSMAF